MNNGYYEDALYRSEGVTPAGQGQSLAPTQLQFFDNSLAVRPSGAVRRIEQRATIILMEDAAHAQLAHAAVQHVGSLSQLSDQLAQASPGSREKTAAIVKAYTMRCVERVFNF